MGYLIDSHLIYDADDPSLVALWWKLGAKLTLPFFDSIHPISRPHHFWEAIQSIDARERCVVQYWGHGSPGAFYVAGRPIPVENISAPRATLWLRTCDSLQDRALADSLLWSFAAVAGHTTKIGHLGLHPGYVYTDGGPYTPERTITALRMRLPKP